MGLGDLFGKKKHQKEKDAKIEQVSKLMAAGDYRAADEILQEIYQEFSRNDTVYRKDDLEALMAQCKAGLKQQEEQAKADRLAEKDKIIEEIKAALKNKNWQKAIELLDIAEDNYDINHRSKEMEDLCIQAQEMCFDSDGVNDWSDAVYSKMYMRKKADFIKLTRKLVDEGDMSLARDTMLLLDSKYNSGYMDDEVGRLWDIVIDYRNQSKKPVTVNYKKAMKDEALARLDSLIKAGYLDSSVYSRFEKDILCGSFVYSGETPYIKEMNRDYDLYLLAKSYEEELGRLVYHAVDTGRTAYLLTVHDNKEEWPEERLEVGTIPALIHSFTEEDYHYDYVAVYNAGGALGIAEKLNELPQEKYETESAAEEAQETAPRPVEEAEPAVSDEHKAEKDMYIQQAMRFADNEDYEDALDIIYHIWDHLNSDYRKAEVDGLYNMCNMYLEEREQQIIQDNLDAAKKDIENGEYERAMFTLEQLKEYYPGKADKEADELAELCKKAQEAAEKAQPQLIDGKDRAQWFAEASVLYNNKKYTDALYAMENAAQLGDARAMSNTAAMYQMGLGTQADEEKSVYWRHKAAGMGDCNSMMNLSHRYYNGNGVEKDHAKAFYWAEKAVDGDKPEYWFNLAHKYDNCEGIERDDKKYFYRVEKAAQGGVKETFTHCARCYDAGTGTEVDRAKALYWYEKAAETGDTAAMMECFYRYVNAVGTERDGEKAIHWLTEACKAGDANALYELGKMYVEQGKSEEDRQNGYILLAEAGEKGHVDAMMRLADDYLKTDKEKKYEKRFYWYEKAAQAGNSRAMSQVFACYFYGTGTQKDAEKAGHWLWAAINAGNMDAARIMSDFHYNAAMKTGDGQYYEDALYWEEIAANGGDKEAKNNLSHLYLKCFLYEYEKEQSDLEKIVKYAEGYMGTEHFINQERESKIEFLRGISGHLLKHPEAKKYGDYIVSYIEKSADLGATEAMDIAAALYLGNDFVDADYEKAFYWYRKAVDNGYMKSCVRLAIMYYKGIGCRQDNENAFHFYSIAADNGDSRAYGYLGTMYYYGHGCETDYDKAFEYCSIAAENGDVHAKERLIDMYAHGDGCRKDTDKIYALAEEIAAEGSVYGLIWLSLCYADGLGCRRDPEKAFSYMQQAAEKEYDLAYYYLGSFYEDGCGCVADPDKAFEMYRKAADNGIEEALEKVAYLIRMNDIIDSEIEKGKETAKKYINSDDPEIKKLAREILDME